MSTTNPGAKTYLITLTQAETPELWLAQTSDFPDLMLRVSREGGGLRKGTIFTLGLAPVQKNNCMNAKLLDPICQIPPRDFQLWIDETLRRATLGRSAKEASLMLASLHSQVEQKLALLMKGPQNEMDQGSFAASGGTSQPHPTAAE